MIDREVNLILILWCGKILDYEPLTHKKTLRYLPVIWYEHGHKLSNTCPEKHFMVSFVCTEWICNSIPHLTGHMITYTCWDWSPSMLLKGIPGIPVFLHRPCISLRIKSISNELYITFHVIASQLSGHCDVTSNVLWRHQQNARRASETLRRCVEIVVFVVIYGFALSCEKWRTVYALTLVLFWCLFSSSLRNPGNEHQNNPLVST